MKSGPKNHWMGLKIVNEQKLDIHSQIDQVYKLYKPVVDLFFGVDRDLDQLPSTRKRQRTKKLETGTEVLSKTNSTIPDTVAPGYGEITQQSFNVILDVLQYQITEPSCRLGTESRFLDLGSGFGKCVVHAKLRSHCQSSIGIEYISTRNEKANELVNEVRSRLPGLVESLTSCNLIQGDFTHSVFNEIIRQSSHIYMFNILFPQEVMYQVFQLIKEPNSQCKIVICNTSPSEMARVYNLEWTLLHQLTSSTTGGQSFESYIYTVNKHVIIDMK
jgi:tRNA G46 methylase TrmB